MLEVEVKIKAVHKILESKLIELGYSKESYEYEKDVYFNSEHQDLKSQDKALRIRTHIDLASQNKRFSLNYKGPKLESTTMTREETEFMIPDFEHGEKLLNGLGFYAAGQVEKTRTSYTKDRVTCCLDNVTDLGEFLEIEIIEDSEYDKAIAEIKNILESLELKFEDTIRKSYLSMLSFADAV